MTLSPHVRSTAAALLRWFATWLALIVLVQGLAAADARGSGPLHHHRQSGVAMQQGHHHDGAERHHHSAENAQGSAVAVAETEPSVESGAFAITAALALMALVGWRIHARTPRTVLRPAPAWAWRTNLPATPRKPPRPA
ncbi:MAG: hypothetical protein ABIQ29_07250 [Burkholderiaceae bacterium]